MSILLQTVIRRTWLRFLDSLASTYCKYAYAPSPCEIATSHDASRPSRRTLINRPG